MLMIFHGLWHQHFNIWIYIGLGSNSRVRTAGLFRLFDVFNRLNEQFNTTDFVFFWPQEI